MNRKPIYENKACNILVARGVQLGRIKVSQQLLHKHDPFFIPYIPSYYREYHGRYKRYRIPIHSFLLLHIRRQQGSQKSLREFLQSVRVILWPS